HLVAAAFAEDQYPNQRDATVVDDDPGRDRLLLADFLEDPGAAPAAAPVAHAQGRVLVTEDLRDPALDVAREPDGFGRGHLAREHFPQKRLGLLIDRARRRSGGQKKQPRQEQRGGQPPARSCRGQRRFPAHGSPRARARPLAGPGARGTSEYVTEPTLDGVA